MYVSVDRDRLVFCHKHRMRQVVEDLAWLECVNFKTLITPVQYRYFLNSMTDLECRLLYEHTTGQQCPTLYGRAPLRAVLQELAERLPECDVVPGELAYQCTTVHDTEQYRYEKGRTLRPAGDLWAPQLTTPASPQERDIAAQSNQRMEKIAQAAPQAQRLDVTRTSRKPSSAPAAPRGVGVRQIIWDAADAAWEAAGKPIDRAQILALRKEVMDTLEQQGVKRTSASNELGNWQKARTTSV